MNNYTNKKNGPRAKASWTPEKFKALLNSLVTPHELLDAQTQNDLFEYLKKFISQYEDQNRPVTKEDLVAFIQKAHKSHTPKKSKYRQPGQLVDQKLKYPKTSNEKVHIELEETKKKIKESKIEVKVEGIKLTAAEYKLDHALSENTAC